MSLMTSNDDPTPEKTPREKLAELVAQRKAAGGHAAGKHLTAHKGFERAAAASSASKSKPAARKG
jgi:hypothetical protein